MERIACSFCGASNHHVEQMVAGPTVFICCVCVDLCREMLEDGPAARWSREAGEAEYRSWVAA